MTDNPKLKLKKNGEPDKRSINGKLSIEKARLARQANINRRKEQVSEKLKQVEADNSSDSEEELIITRKPPSKPKKTTKKPKQESEDEESPPPSPKKKIKKQTTPTEEDNTLIKELNELKLMNKELLEMKKNKQQMKEKKKAEIKPDVEPSAPKQHPLTDAMAKRDYLLKVMRGEILNN